MTNLETSKPERLVTQARQGNVGALGELLDLYRNYLSILAQSQVGRKLQAKVDPSDLVQETLLQAHRDFPRFLGTTEAELMKGKKRGASPLLRASAQSGLLVSSRSQGKQWGQETGSLPVATG